MVGSAQTDLLRMRLFIGVLFLLGVFTACCGSSDGPQRGAASHGERGVTVDVEVVVDADGAGIATATFTPDNEEWHLYDLGLPSDGIEGFGRPTRLDLTNGAASVQTTTANLEPYDLRIDSLGIAVPVYPDGPVTLTTPFVSTEGTLDVSLTYMSCGSDGGCTVPVINRVVQIDLTQAD